MDERYDERIGDVVLSAGPIPWSVREVYPREDYKLHLTFADGARKVFDCRTLLEREPFRCLANTARFMSARVSHGTVDWGDDVDISPEYLYGNSVLL